MSYNPGTSRVDMVIQNNATWSDSWQFGYPDDQSWNFVGASFLLGVEMWDELKPFPNAPGVPVAEFTSAGGTITIVDVNQRILAMNVSDTLIQASLLPSCSYVYDLIMVVGSVRTPLMWGKLDVVGGITP